MPVPLAELIWDYQVIDDDGVEQEILAFAVKPKVAEDFCERVMEIGLNPVQITPAPVLDYNAMRASGIGLDSGETLVVNIGARSTNLLFINPTGFLLRPLSIGGNSLTQNISDNLGTQFEKAEEIKKNYFSEQWLFQLMIRAYSYWKIARNNSWQGLGNYPISCDLQTLEKGKIAY